MPTSPTLAHALTQPLPSLEALLGLLIPQLASLDLLNAEEISFLSRWHALPSSSSSRPLVVELGTSPTSGEEQRVRERERWLNRQLGLVQRAIVASVWPVWADALQREEGGDSLVELVVERWFVPRARMRPLPSSSRSLGNPCEAAVAISSYFVWNSLLANRTPRALLPTSASTSSPSTAVKLHPDSLKLTLQLLDKLLERFALPEIWAHTFAAREGVAKSPPEEEEDSSDEESEGGVGSAAMVDEWEAVAKVLFKLPTLIANACGREKVDPPPGLEYDAFLATLTTSYHVLLLQSSHAPQNPRHLSPISLPLSLLIPFCTPSSPTSPTFWSTLLPHLLPELLPSEKFPTPAEELLSRARLRGAWAGVWDELSAGQVERALRSFATEVERVLLRAAAQEDEEKWAINVRATAWILGAVFGAVFPPVKGEEGREIVIAAMKAVFLDGRRPWSEGLAQAVVLWITTTDAGDLEAVNERWLAEVMSVWADESQIKLGTTAGRVYLTALLLRSLASLPPAHPALIRISHSQHFLSAISAHLGLMNETVRLMGMLVAEVVSLRTTGAEDSEKALSFGGEMWSGAGEGREIARRLRERLNLDLLQVEGKAWRGLVKSAWSAEGRQLARPASPVVVKRAPIIPKPEPVATPAPARRPLIQLIGEDESDDLPSYALPPEPPLAVLEALSSTDPSLYATALPTSSSSSQSIRPPVYIADLLSYLKGDDPRVKDKQEAGAEERKAQLMEVALDSGPGLVRRKRGWGGELREYAGEAGLVLVSLQDQWELDRFEERKVALLASLVWAEPERVAPALIEQYFTPHLSLAQRHSLLTALALAARELALLPVPNLALSNAAPSQDTSFPSKRLPPALHRRLLPHETLSPPTEPTLLEQMTGDLADVMLSGAREGGEKIVPDQGRTRLLTVRAKRGELGKKIEPKEGGTFPGLAAEFFVLPLVNRFFLHLRDTATSASAARGGYLGGRGEDPILHPLGLNHLLKTLALLLHAARHSPHFTTVLAPDTLSLVLALRPLPNETESSALELVLTLLDGALALDGGREWMREGGESLAEVKDWAEAVFEREEGRGTAREGVGRSARAAAGVVLRIAEIWEGWRGTAGW